MDSNIITFIRNRDYQFIKELGQGACGKTVLLFDDIIDQSFVCKKFFPCVEEYRQEHYNNFIREIKILLQLLHHNIVRIYNYYLYPDKYTGYILMEYVEGEDIDDYLSNNPETINEIFIQIINGFKFLESKNVLHRDIRTKNLLVTNSGIVKIIDFGFGKVTNAPEDFEKSIDLNWCYDLPDEFSGEIYNFQTEIYFIGKLFEKIIQDYEIKHFAYKDLLRLMCNKSPSNRVSSFFDIDKEINSNRFSEIYFNETERKSYQEFSECMRNTITRIEQGTKYYDDIEWIEGQLENSYRSMMLEEYAPDSATVCRCFLKGGYYYHKKNFPVTCVRNFLALLRSSSHEKKRIILANLHTTFDSVTKYEKQLFGDDIPF